MSRSNTLHIGLSLAPTWLNGNAWRRADSRAEDRLKLEYYVDLAQRAEAAKLDFVFRPDTLFLNSAALEKGQGGDGLDATLLMAAIAHATDRIGLLTTISTTFFPPYLVARQVQSLNVLSKGRAGWNIVTALDGNDNFGLDDMPSPEERYARAAEFTEVVQALWQSYPEEALIMNKATGHYADTEKINPIDHSGASFKVKGPLNVPAPGQSRIPLIQAGASSTGRNFASSIADAIFAATPDKQAAIELRQDLRSRATDHGRSPDDILVLPGLSLYLADTRQEAEELFLETHSGLDRARKLASIAEMTGLDLTAWPTDKAIRADDLPPSPEKVRSRTHSDLLRRMIRRDEPTLHELLKRPEVIGSAHWQIVGTVEDAVHEIADWKRSGAVDGFIAVPGGSVGSLALTLEELIPALVDERLFRKDYQGTTFLEHLAE